MMFKKSFFCFMLIFFSIILLPFVLADGKIQIFDGHEWRFLDEERQVCAINYVDGTQNMILTVGLDKNVSGDSVVWLFPIPSTPDDVEINVFNEFPFFAGTEVGSLAKRVALSSLRRIKAYQIYTFPFFYFDNLMSGSYLDGVNFHGSVSAYGLTTQLITSEDSDAIFRYAEANDLVLLDESKDVLDYYIGENYSFVVSWIYDIEEFKANLIDSKNTRRWGDIATIGVFVSFPTDRIFYPVIPTSVYGDLRIPTTIFVFDFVEPEVYPALEEFVEVNYYLGHVEGGSSLGDFFSSRDSQFYSDRFHLSNEKYTLIEIDAPSFVFEDDLWMDVSTPMKISLFVFIIENEWFLFFVIVLVFSLIASYLAHLIVLKKSHYKFALLGVGNFLSLAGFMSCLLVINYFRKSFFGLKSNSFSFKKSFIYSVVFSFILIFLFFLFLIFIEGDVFNIRAIVVFLVIVILLAAAFFPFVISYFVNRKLLFISFLFSFIFLSLIFILEFILKSF